MVWVSQELSRPDGPAKRGYIIANALAGLPGVEDSLLYTCLPVMIDAGELRIMEPARPDNPYSAKMEGGAERLKSVCFHEKRSCHKKCWEITDLT